MPLARAATPTHTDTARFAFHFKLFKSTFSKDLLHVGEENEEDSGANAVRASIASGL